MSDEPILTIRVALEPPLSVSGGRERVVMIPFTGEAEGPLFRGRILPHGVDTQRRSPDGRGTLSARYMLEGTDADGAPCRIFIENQGSSEAGWRPRLVTDSPLLAPWETAALRATVTGAGGGVTVKIYRDE